MNKNKNRLEIRLDPDSQELLSSLIVRTSLTKTSLIKKALIVYASTLTNGHIYTVKLKGEPIKTEEKPQNKEPKKEYQFEDKPEIDPFEELKRDEEEREKLERQKKEDELPF